MRDCARLESRSNVTMYRADTSAYARGGGSCSTWPSSVFSTSRLCTAMSCANSSTPSSAPSGQRSVTACFTPRFAGSKPRLDHRGGGDPAGRSGRSPLTSRRGRVVYKITAEGKERFQDLLAKVGPETYEDAGFGVHFAFFSRTERRCPPAHPGRPPPQDRRAAGELSRRARPRRRTARRLHA